MTSKSKVEVLPPLQAQPGPAAFDPFHQQRLPQDLARFIRAPGLFAPCLELARVCFQKAGERAILERYIEFFQTGERLVAAKVAMERRRSEYQQLAREHQVKEAEKSALLAKLQADAEEDNWRRDRTAYQREHVERFVEGGPTKVSSVDEQQLDQANARRQLDTRWQLQESLRALQSLIELQHWRRQQRDRILQDRSLTSAEQSEDLQFVDDLYQQKRTELKVDIRIFEEE